MSAWTEGQWYVSAQRGIEHGTGLAVIPVHSLVGDEVTGQRPLVAYATYDPDAEHMGSAHADATLIALAPRMAATILRIVDNEHGRIGPYGDIDTSFCGCDNAIDCADLSRAPYDELHTLATELRRIKETR